MDCIDNSDSLNEEPRKEFSKLDHIFLLFALLEWNVNWRKHKNFSMYLSTGVQLVFQSDSWKRILCNVNRTLYENLLEHRNDLLRVIDMPRTRRNVPSKSR